MNSHGKAASLAAMIKQRMDIDAVLKSGKTGRFDVLADEQLVAVRGGNWFTRRFGAGYPDPEEVITQLKKRQN